MPRKVTIYGIKNCDTMKKARAWLDAQGVDYAFHDYKAAGIDRAALKAWTGQVGWEILLNRKGTTWRGLSESDRADLDESRATVLMLSRPMLIKRPVVQTGDRVLVGFDPDVYAAHFAP